MTKWSWIMTCVVISGFLMLIRLGIRESVIYEFRDVRVERTAPYEYWITPRSGGTRFHTTVCRDYFEPQFMNGMILNRVIFADQGTCWSLDPNKHAGYFIQRGKDGRPIIEETAN